MWLLGSVLAVTLLTQAAVAAEDRPLTSTSHGLLRGIWQTSAEGRRYAAFMTIPFAKPPVGYLRFEPPEPLEQWQGEWDAGQIAPSCMTFSHLLGVADTQQIKGQEDCLYLNVYTPKLQREQLLPVIVYIHGGAFMFGGSEYYGPRYLMDRGVVFVTINYRLGPLGFLSLGDDVQPGNNGMRDQVVALRWVRDNIAHFGGDPKSVTLFGVSAGGASVHYHYLSPLSKDLFHRGISLSGTALCRWALADGAVEKALQLAASVGCPTDQGSQTIINCLKGRPAERILQHVDQFQVWQYSPFSPFAPVVERRKQKIPPFLPDEPAKMLDRGAIKQVPWITSVTTSEGLYPVASFVALDTELALLDSDFETLVPHLLHFNFTVPPGSQGDVARIVRKEYFGQQHVSVETIPQVIKMVSDRLFVVDAQRAAQMQARHTPVYFYQFDFRGKRSLSDIMSDTTRNFGVSHADDMFYVMNTSYVTDENRTGMAKRVQTLLLDLVTSFATTGIPEAKEAPKWGRVTPGGDLEFLKISTVPPVMTKSMDLGNAAFWESLPFLEGAQCLAHSSTAEKVEL